VVPSSGAIRGGTDLRLLEKNGLNQREQLWYKCSKQRPEVLVDYTTVHPLCASQAHHIDLHLWRGPPENLDETRPVQILVNQGYVVGFCPARLQPAWSAYRVAHAEADVDYDRPLHYHDDLRLPADLRIGRTTFGKLGDVRLDVGHMTPNEVVNRQFGRLAQMETFLMSNMSPQYNSLNTGVWSKLETAIREIKDEKGKDHVWAIVGPIFDEQPASISRSGKNLPVPRAYFAIVVDPHTYPFDKLSNAQMDCFIIPQEAPPSSNPQDYPATLPEIEEGTRLKFFSAWGRDVPVALLQLSSAARRTPSRLMQVLEEKQQEWSSEASSVEAAQPIADSLEGMVASLQTEATALQSVDRPLSHAEEGRLSTIQHTISWLLAARRLNGPSTEAEQTANLITYKIVSDMDDRLKEAARTACNFWNRFVQPAFSIVIRLGTFTQMGSTIARAYKPYEKDGVRYGRVEFNTKYLVGFTAAETAGTIVHEIGHTLGIGWEKWDALFDASTGRFNDTATSRLQLLANMEVELEGGGGTALSHWDEETFDRELMTGYKDSGEHVLPVTVDLMELLGHTVLERLGQKTSLDQLLGEVTNVVFFRQDEARRLDLDHFEETEVFETIPHRPE
jgi:DNA/RNA endonuclease G (NUC1)